MWHFSNVRFLNLVPMINCSYLQPHKPKGTRSFSCLSLCPQDQLVLESDHIHSIKFLFTPEQGTQSADHVSFPAIAKHRAPLLMTASGELLTRWLAGTKPTPCFRIWKYVTKCLQEVQMYLGSLTYKTWHSAKSGSIIKADLDLHGHSRAEFRLWMKKKEIKEIPHKYFSFQRKMMVFQWWEI